MHDLSYIIPVVEAEWLIPERVGLTVQKPSPGMDMVDLQLQFLSSIT